MSLSRMNGVQIVSCWTKQETLLLLEELKKNALIYDPTHPLHHHRAARLASLRTICKKLQPTMPTLSPDGILKKIKVIKNQYYKEKKLVDQSAKFEKRGASPYQPKLWCYDLVGFLDVRAKRRAFALQKEKEEAMRDVADECIIDESNESNNDPFGSFEEVQIERIDPHQQPEIEGHSQTRSLLHSKCLKLVETLTNEMGTIKNDKVSNNPGCKHQLPQTFLGIMVESELSSVCEEVYNDAKWKIIRILEESSKKDREIKLRNARTDLPTTSSTSSPSSSYNISKETRVTVLDNTMFQTPINGPICSQVKIMEILNKKK